MNTNERQSAEKDYTVTHETQDYEVGVLWGEIIAACRCGAGEVWPNKGLGRAFAATWRTRHQHATPAAKE